MQNLFLFVLIVLVAFSQVMVSLTEHRFKKEEGTVLYWMTDTTPTRIAQVRGFSQWLSNHQLQPITVKIDSTSGNIQKKIIQGVSGVAGDLIDMYSGDVHTLHSIDILDDVTEIDHNNPLFLNSNYNETVKEDLFSEGRRYAYSCNNSQTLLIANKKTLAQFGFSGLPERWTYEEFEKIGKEFVRKANEGKSTHEIYFCYSLDWRMHLRGAGIGAYNETYTGSGFTKPGAKEALQRLKDWTYKDHLIPTSAEIASFSADSGYGGAVYQFLYHGRVAMVHSGLWTCIGLREMGKPIDLIGFEPPHNGFPNTYTGTRSTGIYKGGKHKKEATLFLAYLTSPEYNRTVIEDSDGNPTAERYLLDPEFIKPKAFPGEWSLRETVLRATTNTAISKEYPKYAMHASLYKKMQSEYEAFLSDRLSAEQALLEMEKDVQVEIKIYLSRHPEKKALYEKSLVNQKIIDEKIREKKKIPLELVENVFYKKYYALKNKELSSESGF